ncbi:guanylate kinase [Moraxella atlantae]|uniref:Guanylate kinase n=1 Tax=Faucicola atlantae TaxID=34059 RepID=A0A1B8QKI9_9GAMM|nr:guanylate kinase [Moraxella atlantae]OBX80676.1 guanylate kinase [Moraxella atlantae]OBX84020.1 guanylate kinase [Moraxella atlantae]
MTTGSLFIITAASGTGKTSLVKQLLATTNDLAVSVSHSTRAPRPGEVDGQHYHFVSREVFQDMIARGDFLEFADVFDNFYGTSQASVDKMLASGLDVILEIDWQGALQVQKLRPDAISVFILPPDRQSLRQRLSTRAQDSAEVIEKRLAGAVRDMQQYLHFDYVVVNDNFDVALADLKAIIMANRLTLAKQQQAQAARIERLLSE